MDALSISRLIRLWFSFGIRSTIKFLVLTRSDRCCKSAVARALENSTRQQSRYLKGNATGFGLEPEYGITIHGGNRSTWWRIDRTR